MATQKYGWSSVRATAKHLIDSKAGPGVITGTQKSLCGLGGGWLRIFTKADINGRFPQWKVRIWKRLQALGVCDKCQAVQRAQRKNGKKAA